MHGFETCSLPSPQANSAARATENSHTLQLWDFYGSPCAARVSDRCLTQKTSRQGGNLTAR
jgi:hypothetical protein